MEPAAFYIAELNIARLKAPLDAPSMKEFVDFLEPVNRFAEQSPGFVWRLTAGGGLPSSYLPPAFEDEMIATNLTVWEDIDALKEFVYKTVHTYFLRSQKKWFESVGEIHMVMWWIPAGHTPTLEEAKQKLEYLAKNGPTPDAFTMQTLFDRDRLPMRPAEPTQAARPVHLMGKE